MEEKKEVSSNTTESSKEVEVAAAAVSSEEEQANDKTEKKSSTAVEAGCKSSATPLRRSNSVPDKETCLSSTSGEDGSPVRARTPPPPPPPPPVAAAAASRSGSMEEDEKKSSEGSAVSTHSVEDKKEKEEQVQKEDKSNGDEEEDEGDDSFWSSFDEAEPTSTSSTGTSSQNPSTSESQVAIHIRDDDTKPSSKQTHQDAPKSTSSAEADVHANAVATEHPRGIFRIASEDSTSSTPDVEKARPSLPEKPTTTTTPNDDQGLESWQPFGSSMNVALQDHTTTSTQQQTQTQNDTTTNQEKNEDDINDDDDDDDDNFSLDQLELCRRLDDEYERALEDREVAWKARYTSVRQSAFLSFCFMLLYLVLGCLFYHHHTNWRVSDSLIFTIYTITTVGYGNHDIPKGVAFQIFTVFYILVGIAAITVLAAHMYQFIVLEATKVQFSRDRAELYRRGNVLPGQDHDSEEEQQQQTCHNRSARDLFRERFMMEFSAMVHDRPMLERALDWSVRTFDQTRTFLRTTYTGRIVSIFLPFLGLILFGATVVGCLEGWSVIESIYWAVVTLTTVGFGDYYPRRDASIWFCICYLPSSLFFMSFFLANVAKSYIRLHAVHVARLEHRMRTRIKRAREDAEKKRLAETELSGGGSQGGGRGAEASDPAGGSGGVLTNSTHDGASAFRGTRLMAPVNTPPGALGSEGFETLPMGEDMDRPTKQTAQLFGSPEAAINGSLQGLRRRESVLHHCHHGSEVGGSSNMDGYIGSPKATSSASTAVSKLGKLRKRKMTSMKAVLKSLRMPQKQKPGGLRSRTPSATDVDFDVTFNNVGSVLAGSSMTSAGTASSSGTSTPTKKPSFAVRMMVQERLAGIIAADVAGYQSDVIIKENTLSITIDTLKETADKWMIPRRARKAFRSVAFQCLFFVGEHDLITRGPDALFCLNPFEFHGIFSPLLAAFGDAETMEAWLASTAVLADVELKLAGEGDLETVGEETGRRRVGSEEGYLC